jgi:hypothetical protein
LSSTLFLKTFHENQEAGHALLRPRLWVREMKPLNNLAKLVNNL